MKCESFNKTLKKSKKSLICASVVTAASKVGQNLINPSVGYIFTGKSIFFTVLRYIIYSPESDTKCIEAVTYLKKYEKT